MLSNISSSSWTTTLLCWRGLHTSLKLWAMPCRVTHYGRMIVKSSDKTWSTAGGNGKPFLYACSENIMNSVRRNKLLYHIKFKNCLLFWWLMNAYKWSEVAQSRATLWDSMDCSLPSSSIRGIFLARVLEWVAISFSRGSSWLRDWTWVSCTAGGHFTF